MSTALLDSFQYVVGIYILYVAVRGKGSLYRFGSVRESDRELVRRRLRAIYFAVAALCFVDGAASSLLNTLFRVAYAEDGTKLVTRSASLSWWPGVSYGLLNAVVSVSIGLIVVLLVLVLVTVRRHSDKQAA